jgi:hypothetical protein
MIALPRAPLNGLRVSRTCALGPVALLSACVSLHHSIAPYDTDSVAAQALESRASEICAAVRGREALPPYRFTTDGCSLFPDNGWQQCCIEHDIDYWCGGSAVDRCAADRRLRACARAGSLMYLGVRVGGHPWWPFAWRWGYGWPWPYSYDDPADRRLLRGSDEGCAAEDPPPSFPRPPSAGTSADSK